MKVFYYCKSCSKPVYKRYAGYCQTCWRYFEVEHGKVYPLPKYGEVSYVEDTDDKQFGMAICHICGKAYKKLQQHIYYAHGMYKHEYCTKFGIDNKSRLTSEDYHNVMRGYAYKYNMPEQLKSTGVDTRFKAGQSNKYIRSAMTMKRLKEKQFNKN